MVRITLNAKPATTKMLSSAMDAVAVKVAAIVRQQIATAMHASRGEKTMMRKTVTPDFTLSASLDEEMAHGDHLIEVLKLAARSLDHERHTIAVLGTQITVGDVIDGALARHAARRNTAEED